MTATEIIRATNSEEFTLRCARNNQTDGERFCALSNSLYARKVDLAYYCWQFFGGPFPSVLSMAYASNGDLAGCYGFQLRSVAGNSIKIGSAIDIMIAPAFQGKGLFRRLAHHALGQLCVYNPAAVFVMANARAGQVHARGLGWQEVTTLQDWIISSMALPAVDSNVRLLPLAKLGTNEDAYLRAAAARRGKVSIGLARDAALWQWRFLDNPRYRYELFRAEHQGELIGLLALKLFTDPVTGERFGDIVDIAWREEDAATLPALLTGAANHLRNQGAQQISTWLQTNTELDEAGRQMGFQPTTRQRHLVCKVLNADCAWLEDPTRWRATMADTEMY